MADKYNHGKGLTGNYTAGENDWGSTMNANLEKLNIEQLIIVENIVGLATDVPDITSFNTPLLTAYAVEFDGEIHSNTGEDSWTVGAIPPNFCILNKADGLIYRYEENKFVRASTGTPFVGIDPNGVPDPSEIDNYDGNGAQAKRSIAIGLNALVEPNSEGDPPRDGGVAIGSGSYSEGNAVAIGKNTEATPDSTAVGTNIALMGYAHTVVGMDTRVSGNNNIVYGKEANVGGDNNIAVGNSVTSVIEGEGDGVVPNNNNISLGNDVTIKGGDVISIGHGRPAIAKKAIAIGGNINSPVPPVENWGGGGASISIGHDIGNTAPGTIAVGSGINATAPGQVVVGNAISVGVTDAIVIGTNTTVGSGNNAVVIGAKTTVMQAQETVAIGTGSTTSAGDSVSIGNSIKTKGFGMVHIGKGSDVGDSSLQSIVLGSSLKHFKAVNCVILESEQTPTDSALTKGFSHSVRIGHRNEIVQAEDAVGETSHHISIGIGNKISGNYNSIIGADNELIGGGAYSHVLGSENIVTAPFSQVVGNDNITIPDTVGGGRIGLFGYGNSTGGFEVSVLGNQNDLNVDHNLLSVTGSRNTVLSKGVFQSMISGSENKIGEATSAIGDIVRLAVIGNKNTLTNKSSINLVTLGNENVISSARATVIGNTNGVTADDVVVLGNNILADAAGVTYIGNGTSIDFTQTTSHTSHAGEGNAYSYLTDVITYGVVEANSDNWYRGKKFVALPNAVLSGVADGALDNHAVNVGQLKKLVDITNNDYDLSDRANEFCYVPETALTEPAVDAPIQQVTWVSQMLINLNSGTVVRESTTVAEKIAFLSEFFIHLGDHMSNDPVPVKVGSYYKLNLPEDRGRLLTIEYRATDLEGNFLEDAPLNRIISGGYNPITGVTLGLTGWIYHRPNFVWKFNRSLHPVKFNRFFMMMPEPDVVTTPKFEPLKEVVFEGPPSVVFDLLVNRSSDFTNTGDQSISALVAASTYASKLKVESSEINASTWLYKLSIEPTSVTPGTKMHYDIKLYPRTTVDIYDISYENLNPSANINPKTGSITFRLELERDE